MIILLLLFSRSTGLALHGQAPRYISELVIPFTPARHLRSQNANLLIETRFKSNCYGDRAFSRFAPRLWNSMPHGLGKCSSLSCFKKHLKTYLFQSAFKVPTI
ncbi:hypothetical protein HOLleu_11030 [Holothuria leucospilota]|uniref:Secreted protein n=1 Tax=Holothuria leucospilota TaxID=206669 RepID=A0A9Q1CE30_HOLLE|nr:hypothetical protein HOLleu_11030 [Holothuria leucospilota]